MKSILFVCLLSFFVFACAGPAAFISPGFTGSNLNQGGIAILPTLAGQTAQGTVGLEPYCRTVGENLNVYLKKKHPDLRVLGPSEVGSVLAKENLVKDYAQMMENYKTVKILDTDVITKISKPIGVKYLLISEINSLYPKGSTAVATLSGRIISVERAETVFEYSVTQEYASLLGGLTGPNYQKAVDFAGERIIDKLNIIWK